jgi:sulfur-carrier protein adenylyltransferase/sulfurtransferase
MLGRRPAPPDPPERGRSPIEEVLNLGRWAPSVDNAQPWRFQILDAQTVAVRLHIERGSVYEYRDGEPTWLSAGMLVESLGIAASAYGCEMRWEAESSHTEPRLLLRLPPAPEREVDPLVSVLTLRSVDRHRYHWRGLHPREKAALEAAVGGRLRLDWHESVAARWRLARLNGMATDIRLRCPETFPIHQHVIDWQRALSPEGIPARAVGLAAPMLPILRWALSDWSRMQRLNRLAGTWGTAAQLDYLPALGAGAFVVFRNAATETGADRGSRLIEAGRAIQRFWLTTTKLGLAMQPTLAMLAFAAYGESETGFTVDAAVQRKAVKLAGHFGSSLGLAPAEVVFVARVGEPRRRLPSVRSSRLPLDRLIERQEPERADVTASASIAQAG